MTDWKACITERLAGSVPRHCPDEWLLPGLSREATRALAGVDGQVKIYSGIDIDVPTELNEKRTQPADVRAATLAALHAGAPGVVLSRKYAEMKLTNIAGAKQALQEFGAHS